MKVVCILPFLQSCWPPFTLVPILQAPCQIEVCIMQVVSNHSPRRTSRRNFLTSIRRLAAAAWLLPFIPGRKEQAKDRIVIVNGWVLREDDLENAGNIALRP